MRVRERERETQRWQQQWQQWCNHVDDEAFDNEDDRVIVNISNIETWSRRQEQRQDIAAVVVDTVVDIVVD